MRPHGSPEELEKRRKKAISLSRKGNQTIEIAHVIGTTRRSIRRWKAAFRTQGAEGIRSKPSPGRPTKLSEEQKRDLEQELLKGAKAFGYLSDLWTCPRIAQLISHKYGVLYHVDHIGRLLHSLGWSPQKPQRRALERDEQKVATWIKEEWPRIKKKRDA
jgi:transposase